MQSIEEMNTETSITGTRPKRSEIGPINNSAMPSAKQVFDTDNAADAGGILKVLVKVGSNGWVA